MSLPEHLGRLRRVRRLGSGGFASVWLYRDDELDSYVAVKALADNWAQNADVRERFLSESRLLRRAQSEHVVWVHDIGVTDDDTPYFVMTYADQGSIADLLSSGVRPNPGEVIEIVSQAAQGLSALHALHIVHRDIKPHNLLLATRPDGSRRVVVADLGVAKHVAADAGTTMHVGTPAYAAPEQADPTARLDGRADVHGLGAVAYALIAGRPPRLVPGPPVALGDLVPGVPPDVDRVIRTALERDPAHRWPDATTFARALAAAVGGTTPVPAPAPTPDPDQTPADRTHVLATGDRPGPPRRRWRLGVAAIVAVAVALAAAALLTMTGGDDENAADDQAGVVSGYEVAARKFLTALQEGQCDDVRAYLDVDLPEDWDCQQPLNDELFFYGIAQKFDLDGETRVEDLGDGQYRVVWVDQGYVIVSQRSDSTMRVEGLVG